MTLHREGVGLVTLAAGLAVATVVLLLWLETEMWLIQLVAALGLLDVVLIAQFFRIPKRVPVADEGQILCPSDGKVVVIEEVEEPEVLGDKRIQVSIFMSPLNVHAQWAPMAGEVTHANYHPGKYLVAWHPKSSTENERTTLVINGSRGPVLFRQICRCSRAAHSLVHRARSACGTWRRGWVHQIWFPNRCVFAFGFGDPRRFGAKSQGTGNGSRHVACQRLNHARSPSVHRG